MAHERSVSDPQKSELLGGLGKPNPQVSAVEADWLCQSLSFALMAAVVVRLVAAVAESSAEGVPGVYWESVPVGSENEVM